MSPPHNLPRRTTRPGPQTRNPQEVAQMESASAPAQDSAPAQRGTLADPEILQNVPGHLIPIIEREFDDFKTEATKFLAGDIPEDEFIKFRLKQGVYGQRQPDVNMVRV